MSGIHLFKWILKQGKNETCYFRNVTIFDSIRCGLPFMPGWVSHMNHQKKLHVISQMDLLYDCHLELCPIPNKVELYLALLLVMSFVTPSTSSHIIRLACLPHIDLGTLITTSYMGIIFEKPPSEVTPTSQWASSFLILPYHTYLPNKTFSSQLQLLCVHVVSKWLLHRAKCAYRLLRWNILFA